MNERNDGEVEKRVTERNERNKRKKEIHPNANHAWRGENRWKLFGSLLDFVHNTVITIGNETSTVTIELDFRQ